MNKGQISNPSINLKPPKKLCDYIKSIKSSEKLPSNILNIYKNEVNQAHVNNKPGEPHYLVTEQDYQFFDSLKLNPEVKFNTKLPLEHVEAISVDNGTLLTVEDLHWLYNYIQAHDQNKVFLHELLEGAEIVLPKNDEIPRNPDLEKRCERLRASQQNKEYSNMTKNVDSCRRKHPEDTISFQIQQMNRHLIAIFQFIVSVLAGFAFGFVGVELIIGSLDFGFRLLLGIICALIIALAELYFLAKKLNEDLKFESVAESKKRGTKLD